MFIPAPSSPSSSGGSFASVTNTPQGFGIAYGAATLDEAPNWTRLDDPTGPVLVQRWEITRGRSYENEKTGPGTAQVTMVDRTGALDPGAALGLDVMQQAAIAVYNPVTDAWSTVFRGFVSDVDYELYPAGGYTKVTVDLVDAFDLLAAIEMTTWTSGGTGFGDPAPLESLGDVYFLPADQVADRINKVLNDCGWPTGLREIFSGNIKLQETVYALGQQALTAMQDAADAEFPGVANVYVQKDGTITFHGRFARFNPTDPQYDITTWECGNRAVVTADPTKALISALTYGRGKTNLINSAVATPQNIADADIEDQRVEDATSKATYGTRSVAFENLLTLQGYVGTTTAVVETKKYATYFVDNYSSPLTRIKRIAFRRLDPDATGAAAVWALMCGVDISDLLQVTCGPFSATDFYVEGVHMTAEPLNDSFLDVELELDVSPRAYYDTSPF